jgi:hypothetical protein
MRSTSWRALNDEAGTICFLTLLGGFSTKIDDDSAFPTLGGK